ncbi:MAG: methylthioribulose 1-phosphate dehydratase [Planctomycetota bacterium]
MSVFTSSLSSAPPFVDHSLALAEVGTEFHSRGWSLGTSSNYSVVVGREPLQLLVTASGKDKGKLTENDFVVVDQEGLPIEDGQPKSSAETLLHCVIAHNIPDVGAILHTHSVWGTLLSRQHAVSGGFNIEGFEMLKGLEGITTHEHSQRIPIFENTQDIPKLAQQLQHCFSMADSPEQALGHGFLIRGHGLYTWGKDLFTARRHIEILEFLFECVSREQSLASSL